jgi:3-dehydroquinate synthase
VSDSKVFALHGARVLRALSEVGVPITKTVVPSGERSKSVKQLERIWRASMRSGADRQTCFIALGGGVVGDLTGFAAASLLRGVRVVQIPTTVLAMVDSSVGGKTGINLPEGKNLVGAFFQPEAVFTDLEFLRSLPVREVRAGWAEIIKTAAIQDSRFFGQLERQGNVLRKSDLDAMASIVRSSCRVKADVVSKDEREGGLRMILNFGHTFGHGLEAALSYRGLLHGEAVAIGMAFATQLGTALGLASAETGERIRDLLERFSLPTRLPKRLRARQEDVYKAMLRDKKRGPRGQRWIFVPRVGSSEIHEDIPSDEVRVAVKHFLSD